MSQIKKPTLSDYVKIEDFASTCAELSRTLSLLNNHIEILKRSGDVDSLRQLDNDLNTFLSKVVSSYKSTLSENED